MEMENKTSLDNDMAAAVQRCGELLTVIMEIVASKTIDRGSADPSIAAKAQRALANAEFAQTTPARAITSAAKQVVMTLTKSGPALKDGIAAAADIVVAIARLRALQDAEDARQAEMSKVLADAGIPIEGQRLIWKLGKLGVSPPKFDLLTEPELLVLARLCWEKDLDYTHRGNGIWMAIWRAGFIDFPVSGLSEDEAIAVQISRGGDTEEGLIAKKFLEKCAGRTLDISAALALALYRNYDAQVKSRGLRLTGDRADDRDRNRDLDFIFDTLGLSEEDSTRSQDLLERIYHPQMAKFDARRAAEAEAEQALEDFYMPSARSLRGRDDRRRAADKNRQRSKTHTDDDNEQRNDSDHSSEPDPESGALSSDADFADAHEDAPEELAELKDRDASIDADRLLYHEAMGRSNEALDRQSARSLARNPRYRDQLRRRGIDIPEPPPDSDKTEPVNEITIDDSRSASTGVLAASETVRATMTRAERTRMMRGEK